MEWNRPSRSDHYAMQTAYEVRYFLAKQKPRTLDPMRIPFRREERPAPPQTAEEASRRNLAAVIAASGGRFRVRNPDGTLSEVKRGKP